VQAGSNQSEIFPSQPAGCASSATITASASDNVGVTSVTGTYGGGLPGSLNFSPQGGQWRATFGPFNGLAPNYSQLITITVTARDAAGNQASTQVTVRVWGTCLV
jgi:hypothetical protein